VIVTDRLARHFDDVVLQCGLTSYAHPLACAAIVAAIETYRDEKLVERAAALGERLGPRLAALARTRPAIAEVRGQGLLWALELCEPGTKTPLRAHHLHMHKRDNLLYLAPPLVIGAGELDDAVLALERALDEGLA
jgi:taurine--2-oxoglutarate transaminase